jgi:hypothetical protein
MARLITLLPKRGRGLRLLQTTTAGGSKAVSYIPINYTFLGENYAQNDIVTGENYLKNILILKAILR